MGSQAWQSESQTKRLFRRRRSDSCAIHMQVHGYSAKTHAYILRTYVYTALCTACAFKEWWIKGAASTCRALGCHNGVMLVFTFIAASRVSMISLTILSPWRCEREICKIFHCAKYRLSSQLADASGFLFTIRFCLQNVCIY